MDFTFTDVQEQFRSSVRSTLEKECSIALVRKLIETGERSAQPWSSAVELGWPAITIPDAYGGLGMSFKELCLVLEEHGKYLAPGPFVPTVIGFIPLLLEAASTAQKERFLPRIAEGALTGTLAVQNQVGDLICTDHSLVATRHGNKIRLTGTRHHVLDPSQVDELGVAALLDGELALLLVPSGKTELKAIEALDASRELATVDFHDVEIDTDRLLATGKAAETALERTLHCTATGLALEMVGSCQRIFDMTLDYAKQRVQFDKPIGSFQAIQHKFADLFIALEKARSTAYFAAMALAEDDPRRALASSTAKAGAGECQKLFSKEGIQIHGGIGFTWEHDVHLFIKRVKSDNGLFGTGAEHRKKIAELLGV